MNQPSSAARVPRDANPPKNGPTELSECPFHMSPQRTFGGVNGHGQPAGQHHEDMKKKE